MHLAPHDRDKLMLHAAGHLAQKRLARGLRLNYPESVALIATQILELIRDGRSVAELMDLGRTLLGRAQVMDGVPELVTEVQVEGTFPDGTKLVTVHHPIVAEQGDLELALYGSFLPVPAPVTTRATRAAGATTEPAAAPPPSAEPVRPGEVLVAEGDIALNEGREGMTLSVVNTGDRPIQVGSHYHFFETNRALVYDREATRGMRLDIPAGTAVRFEPGESRTVRLVAARRRGAPGGMGDAPATPTSPLAGAREAP